MEPLLWLLVFIVPNAVGLLAVLVTRHLLRNPLSRLYPDRLKHRWSMGIVVVSALYVNFVTPYVLIGQLATAILAFVLTTLAMLVAGQEFLLWILDDLKKHLRERRGLFQHRNQCTLHSYDPVKVKESRARQKIFTDVVFHAYEYVVARQSIKGYWRDFLAPAESTDWTTVLVGTALADSETAERYVLRKASNRLRKDQRPDGGWGYRFQVVSDADTTALSLHFLARAGYVPRRLDAALRFLLSHQDEKTGGFRTYYPPTEIQKFMEWDGNVSFDGWSSSHVCVTANVVQSLLKAGFSPSHETLQKAVGFLESNQSPEGYWESYWWNGRAYSTFSCMRAMITTGNLERVRKAQEWFLESESPEGGWVDGSTEESAAFSTALAVRALLLIPREDLIPAVERGVEWLIKHQLRDGSWVPVPILRVPEPWVMEPWKQKSWSRNARMTGSVVADQSRLITTATALSAVCDYITYSLSKREGVVARETP